MKYLLVLSASLLALRSVSRGRLICLTRALQQATHCANKAVAAAVDYHSRRGPMLPRDPAVLPSAKILKPYHTTRQQHLCILLSAPPPPPQLPPTTSPMYAISSSVCSYALPILCAQVLLAAVVRKHDGGRGSRLHPGRQGFCILEQDRSRVHLQPDAGMLPELGGY